MSGPANSRYACNIVVLKVAEAEFWPWIAGGKNPNSINYLLFFPHYRLTVFSFGSLCYLKCKLYYDDELSIVILLSSGCTLDYGKIVIVRFMFILCLIFVLIFFQTN
jgi:hypothetical protein